MPPTMKKLSIIIPMYNVEPYVEKCIRSLENQDIPQSDYEIICVNDGSPDNCREITETLQQEFSNIVLINQENQGVSMARNNGIDRATAKYLLFIDPDDYVEPNKLASVLGSADSIQSQVHFLGFSLLNEGGSLRKSILNKNIKGITYTGLDAYFISRDGRYDPDRMVAILFKREFLNKNNLRYLPDAPYLEDGELIARILCLAERCTFDGRSFYQRTSRPGSATKSNLYHTSKATNGFILAARNLKKFQASTDLSEAQKEFLNQPICKFVLLAVNSCIGSNTFQRLSAVRNALNKPGLKKCNLNGCNSLYRRYGYLYNISLYLGALALVLFPRIMRIRWILRKGYF